MDDNTALVLFHLYKGGQIHSYDLEIPLDISAYELFLALNEAFSLGVEPTDIKKCFLKSENPIALMKGSKLVKDYGVYNGTRLYYRVEV